MRILQVNSIFDGGGIDSQSVELCRGLAALGDEVVLAVPRECRQRELAQALSAEFTVEAVAGGKPAWAWAVGGMIRRHRSQVVHAHYGRDNWVACLGARLGGIGGAALISRHLMTPLSTTSARWLLRLGHVAAVSRAVYAGLDASMTGPRSHLHLLYGGIDTAHFTPAPDDSALRRSLGWSAQHLVFAVVGYMNPPRGKGQLEFVEAAARLREALPQARFLMVGNGELRETVRQRAEALGLGDRVALLPHQDDIRAVYRACDVLVHPAVGSEALGMVLWEALACGKPVIASRLDGIPEAFEENRDGLLVPPREVAPLAEAMLKLGGDAALRAQFGAAGRAHVEAHFDRRHYAERAQALYSRIA